MAVAQNAPAQPITSPAPRPPHARSISDEASLQPHSPDTLSPPDGGFKAWLQVFIGHLVLINNWGYLSSFGLFQSYYETNLSATGSEISWIGSIQVCLIYLVGAFSGRALDAGFYHEVLALGCFLQLLGVFATSFATEYWQLLLAQGICKGLGDGLTFCPTIALVSTYFEKKRAFAMAFTASGGATGGIVFPLIARQLLPALGFQWTVRVMGFVILFNSIVALCAARVRLPPRRSGSIIEWRAFREPTYALFCAGVFFSLWATFSAYFFISVFAKSVVGVDSSTSLVQLLVLNAVGLPGRVLCGLFADKVLGPVNSLILVVLISGVLFYSWASVSSLGALFAFDVFYGYFGAAIQSLFPASLASLTMKPNEVGVRAGMCFTVVSFACLTGAPIAGALIQVRNGDFLLAQMFGGSSLVAGAVLLFSARLAKSGRIFVAKM